MGIRVGVDEDEPGPGPDSKLGQRLFIVALLPAGELPDAACPEVLLLQLVPATPEVPLFGDVSRPVQVRRLGPQKVPDGTGVGVEQVLLTRPSAAGQRPSVREVIRDRGHRPIVEKYESLFNSSLGFGGEP